MASSDNQQTWLPFDNNKDCSLGYCSPYCLKWCYTDFPPPPPFRFPNEDDSNANVSPLVIAIIGILSGAFLLVLYYLIASRCCRNFDSLRRRSQSSPNEEVDEVGSPPVHEPWQIRTVGLDESVVKSIAVCKYRRGDGLVEGTDCLVCLNEFKEDEYLRLLPKCNHAFHIPCIDTWLKSHTNCPLCRAGIISTSPPPLQLPAATSETLPDHRSLTERRYNDDVLVSVEDLERGGDEVTVPNGTISKAPFRALSDLGRLEERDSIIEITDEEIGPIRRSFSMDSVSQGHPSIINILGMNAEDGFQVKVRRFPAYIRYLRQFHLKSNNRRRVLHCVISPISMKRSSSSGRLSFNRLGRGRNAVIPI